jgi:small GTP-binding protein
LSAASVVPPSRLIPLVVGLSAILGLIIWLIDSILRLYAQVVWTSPFLGNVLILFILALLGFLIYAFIYYFNLSNGNKSAKPRRRAVKLPEQKNETALAQLQALDRQLEQIEDQIAKEAFRRKSQTLRTHLQQGQLKIVVFGVGSAGKTSLVNALLGEKRGQVAAPMGTTQTGQTYVLPLEGVEREIWITDTPGILEAGGAGGEREKEARQLAAEADLLIFVVDNDLRQSEYESLETLAAIGKRSLLALNKKDLYPEEELKELLQTLRARTGHFLAPQDVTAIAAAPADLQIQPGLRVKPDPEISPLLRRLETILRREGEDLIADNLLLQSQRLGESLRQSIDQQRRRQAQKIIDRYQWIGAGVIAATPLPVADLLATAAVNAQMVVEIGQVYGCELDQTQGKALALSLGKTLVGLGLVKGAAQVLGQALQFHVSSFLIGKAIQAVAAAYLTRVAGQSFIQYFRQNQDWGDGGVSEVVREQFQLNRRDEFIQQFVKQAVSRVVEPWSQVWQESPTVPEPLPDLGALPQIKAELIPEPEPVPRSAYGDWEAPPRRRSEW